jgi:cytochrome P450
MAALSHSAPPGPRGLELLRLMLGLSRDPLGLFEQMVRAYGDVVLLSLPFRKRVLVSHPDLIEQVLVVQHHKFHKSAFAKEAIEPLLGQGLLLSEGDFWRRQRRLAQPAFHRARVNEYAGTMVEQARTHIGTWKNGEVRDLAEEMMLLTLAIAVKTLFGAEVDSEANRVGESLSYLMRYQIGRVRAAIRLPETWLTKGKRRADAEYQYLDSLVYRIIAERRASGVLGRDVLSLLMGAMDEDGSQMTPRQLRDETMTLFLAGHETTALTLSWTWYLLSQNPAAEARLHEELAQVLGGRPPQVEDIPRLPYLDAVIREALRLYPPAYILSRTAIEPFELGGYQFSKGVTVLMLPWILHRQARYFDEPEAFRPERWLDGLTERLPTYAYFPFGGGPRRCIGQGFALLEAALLVGVIAQRFRFRLEPGHPVVPEPLITLRTKHGIRMEIQARP